MRYKGLTEKMKGSPCAKCPEKGCGSRHDTCEIYQEWNKERKEALKIRQREMESVSFQIYRIEQFKNEKAGQKAKV